MPKNGLWTAEMLARLYDAIREGVDKDVIAYALGVKEQQVKDRLRYDREMAARKLPIRSHFKRFGFTRRAPESAVHRNHAPKQEPSAADVIRREREIIAALQKKEPGDHIRLYGDYRFSLTSDSRLVCMREGESFVPHAVIRRCADLAFADVL